MRFLIPLLLASNLCWADISLGPTHSTYESDRLKSDIGFTIKAGQDFYAWASYESPKLSLVGQSMGGVKIYGGGLGYQVEIRPNLSVFGEFGYFYPDVVTNNIREEAVTTHLNNVHRRGDFATFERTTYDVSSGYGGRAGVFYELNRFRIGVAYRALRFNEAMDAKTGTCEFQDGSVTAGCRSWWQERGTLGFNSVEFSLLLRL